MDLIAELTSELPNIKVIKSGDKEYDAQRKIYNSAIETKPLAIALPKTAEEVAAIVRFAGQTGASISVRTGGHDLFGRSMVDNGITIDLRSLNHITVNKDAGRATVGGGVQARALCKVLGEHGCLTPCPNIATVGYIGYATMGGYGQMAHKFGLGVDHLLAAKIIDAKGDIVDADGDVMKGIRGAGGNFGIIVEATIKIYPFSQFLAGPIIFESSDYRTSMQNVQAGMEALAAGDDCPPELDFQPMYGFLPPVGGAFYGGLFMWAGPDIERGRKYLDKVAAFHPVAMNLVGPVTMTQSLEANAPLVPEYSYGDARALNVRRITPKIYDILVEAFETMPHDLATMLTWHEVRACSPSVNEGASTGLPAVFNARESHFVIEILGNAVEKGNFEAVSKWAHTLYDELLREAPEEILNTSWLASTPNDEIGSLEKFYGEENARFLRSLKKEKDPNGIFRHAVPNLNVT